jgi:hyperosmotically inducible protein
MSISKWLVVATLVGVGAACAQKPADETTGTTITVDTSKAGSETGKAVDRAVDETKEAADKAADGTKNFAEKTIDKTKDIAGATADKTVDIAKAVGNTTKKVVSTTGETITDTWINSRVSAKFVDESLLKDSNINVDTDDGVVTLKGHVTSNAGKARAAAIAAGSEGVSRVVNELVIRAK